MEKWLCWGSLSVAALFLFLFLIDLGLLLFEYKEFAPFGGMDWVVDFLGLSCSGLLMYLSWNAVSELK